MAMSNHKNSKNIFLRLHILFSIHDIKEIITSLV